MADCDRLRHLSVKQTHQVWRSFHRQYDRWPTVLANIWHVCSTCDITSYLNRILDTKLRDHSKYCRSALFGLHISIFICFIHTQPLIQVWYTLYQTCSLSVVRKTSLCMVCISPHDVFILFLFSYQNHGWLCWYFWLITALTVAATVYKNYL